jgi:hypothetical protein
MANDRIFYACQGVAIQNCGATGAVTTGQMVHGLQSIGVNTNFNLEQAFELGQIAIYENIEGNPEIEVTMEKLIDGYPLIYHLATSGIGPTGATTLLNRSKQKCQVILGIYPDTNDAIDTYDDPPPVEVFMSGLYVSSISYTFPVDGNSTESVTLVGNHKQWFVADGDKRLGSGSTNNFDNQDEPLGSGGVVRRQDVLVEGCIMPASIQGVNGTGVGNAASGAVHIQTVTVSTDLGREDILELGRKMPYARPATFPVEVSCEIEVITTSGDFVDALEQGASGLFWNPKASGNNTKDECIKIITRQGLQIDLGCKNRLQSVTYGGGDAGGGNATCTYSYVTYNTMNVDML